MNISIDDLLGDDIAEFLEAHIDEMRSVSPPESKHALDIEALRQPDITFWSVTKQNQIIGCGALKELDGNSGEIKSMRVCSSARGSGLGSFILEHIKNVALARGYRSLKLETGSMDFFAPARGLYQKHGFEFCGPFADYKLDPNSVFMELQLTK